MDKDVMDKIAGALKTPKWTNKNQQPDPRGAGAAAMPTEMEDNGRNPVLLLLMVRLYKFDLFRQVAVSRLIFEFL